jgi:hypothetical protein
MKPGQFRAWASRRGLKPRGEQPNIKRGQALALWDLADIAEALHGEQPAA